LKRLIWVVNHRALLISEVPIVRSLGWEVFVPKIVPDDPGYRSAVVSHDFDEGLALSADELRILNGHNFYERNWSATLTDIANDRFHAIVASWSSYIHPLSESARKFRGKVIARVFGREHPVTYTSVLQYTVRPNLLAEIEKIGDRFYFGQSYDNIAGQEDIRLARHAHTITVPIADWMFSYKDKWTGGESRAIFLAPASNDGGYYQVIYERIKSNFGDIPHAMFGRQYAPTNDPAILPYLTDVDLITLYITAPVFVYPHTEPIHLHYSPLEAMLVGTPVLYLTGTQLDLMADYEELPGACSSLEDMKAKAIRLIQGDREFASGIRAAQRKILDKCSYDVARAQWLSVLQ
jgi:hypothetical protein